MAEIMGVWEIIALILGSSAVTAAVTAIFARPQTKANAVKTNVEAAGDLSDHSLDLVKVLEDRVKNQDEKLTILEKKIMIFLSAISCIYQCNYSHQFPVLKFLQEIEKNEKIN